jgi:predicted ester cyclase
LEVNETVSEGDRLVVRWTATGTHGGMFRGLAPTGKQINIEGVTLARVKDGKLTEDRVYFDRMTMFEQLGVVPEGLQGRQTMGAG